jgi:hypothetical protein
MWKETRFKYLTTLEEKKGTSSVAIQLIFPITGIGYMSVINWAIIRPFYTTNSKYNVMTSITKLKSIKKCQ